MTATVLAADVTPHARDMDIHRKWLRKQIVRFIDRYHREYNCSPSWGEVSEAAGFATKSGITRHLTQMRDEGLITFHAGRYRSLAVTDEGRKLIGK